ncbi:MAG: D-alanyl-D-alanine carboxypeptidase family protein [Firmicutes bacterium]|nr:D-alanyl-D-alanine carboxypeptidase family protein [Bacillota bacterium]
MRAEQKRTWLWTALLVLLFICVFSPVSPALPAGENGQAGGTAANTYQMLVNKAYGLDSSFVPQDLVPVSNYAQGAAGIYISRRAGEALALLLAEMEQAGAGKVYVNSAYRTYSKQSSLYANKVSSYAAQGYNRRQAETLAAKWVAPPGKSEHQTGLAVDLSSASLGYALNNKFAETPQGKWLKENCWHYGFILRYPQDKTDITGYAWESWHFRYVGAPHAEYIMKHGLTLDQYVEQIRQSGYLTMPAANDQIYAIYYGWSRDADWFGDSLVQFSKARCGMGDYLVTTLQPPGALVDIVGHWGEAYIRRLLDTGLVQGYPDHTFRPNGNITKAELTTMVARLLQLLQDPQSLDLPEAAAPNFIDCLDSDYYYQAVGICYSAGLLDKSLYLDNGDGTASFLPQEIMRRKQVAIMLAGLFRQTSAAKEHLQDGENGTEDDLSDLPFEDLAGQDEQVLDAVSVLKENGVVSGDPQGNFNPESTVTRAEISTMFTRILDKYQNEDAPAAESPDSPETNAGSQDSGSQDSGSQDAGSQDAGSQDSPEAGGAPEADNGSDPEANSGDEPQEEPASIPDAE